MVYLDHAATTPMLPAAMAAMTKELGEVGNPSSLHAAGRRARRVVEESREVIAGAYGARPSEVVFTGGGTESDNLAVKGLFWARQRDRARPRILASAVEHHAVLDPVKWLVEQYRAEVVWLGVDSLGRVDPEQVTAAIATDPDSVALVTVMWANNEVGTVQPIAECVAAAARYGIPVHSDAVQAAGWLDVSFADSGLDALTLSGHKIGGPLGVGAFLLSRTAAPTPLIHGGGQERDIRSGTLDAPAIAGFAAAAQETSDDRAARTTEIGALRDELIAGVIEAVPDARLNGDPRLDAKWRLPGNAHLSFPGCEGDSLLMLLDAYGVHCSTGSACSAGVAEPSHVLLAMGATPAEARSSLRFSLGHSSTRADVRELCAAIGPVVERARAARPSVRQV
ncbi:MAG: cysteine desulfurase family protein [Actinomycetes bacterium]